MFKPTNKGLSCPICNKTNGNCRIVSDNFILCMTHTDGDYSNNGYRFIGNTKDNLWGMYTLNNGNSEDYQNYLDALEQAQLEARRSNDLTLEDIDKNLRLVINSLSLTEEHKQQLLKRKLTSQQIIEGNFASITGFHPLPDNISIKLPGIFIGQKGQKTIGYAKANHLICPIRNRDGLLIGYQKRTDNPNNKYIWAKTNEKKKNGQIIRQEVKSHLPNGELPMAYYGEREPKIIYICDSVALKPYIAHCRHNINIAGGAGLKLILKCHEKQLLELVETCARIIYCPDAGDINNQDFWGIIKELGNWLNHKNKKLEIAWWGQKDKKVDNDIDELDNLDKVKYFELNDFINHYSSSELELKSNRQNQQTSHDSNSKNKNKNQIQLCYEKIQNYFGNGNLAYNQLKAEIELKGEIVGERFDNLYIELGQLGDEFPKTLAYDCAVNLAKENSYHPIKDYLNNLKPPSQPVNIKQLSTQLFNTNEPIYNKMVYYFLIASIARIYQPGCKVDNVLVLNGKQGINKSSFFRTLFSADWFTDNLKDLAKDDLLILHKHWCIEIDELDKITSKKQAGELKAFITKQRDDFRKPYGKTIVSYKRQSVLVGTCNKEEFLVDETGNRRFWVIKVNSNKIDLIDIDWVKTNRDAIWYQAKKDYEAGVKWWLSSSEEIIINESNKQYEHSDVWLDIIEPKLDSYEAITIEKLMRLELNLTEKDMTRANQMRVANILKQLGYEKKRKMANGSRDYVWVKPVSTKNVFEIGEKVQFQVGDLWHIGYIKTINDDLTFDCYWEDKSGFIPNRKVSQIRK